MKIRYYLLAALVLFFGNAHSQNGMSNYEACLGSTFFKGQDMAVLRKFELHGKKYVLAVSCKTLATLIIPAAGQAVKMQTWNELRQLYRDTPYMKALDFAEKQSFSMADAGIMHGYPKEKGITLTIDLCPSHKPLDRDIFNALIKEFGGIEKPVPIGLSLSGRFLLTHSEDIAWLQSLESKGMVRITWINHTYNHHYDPKQPMSENFLLAPGTDVDFEVLGNEIAMIEQGLLPSVFFRFPGLVSDNAIVQKITGYGLLPIGSDAWLAKGQQAASGSIVLIHGNGNEPLGIADFMQLLKSEKGAVLQNQWLMYDLRESIGNEFKNQE